MSADQGSPADWLRFARSDLAIASRPAGGDVMLETLCFHAQQAVEKSLKSVLVAHGITFPRTHNLKTLIDLLPAADLLPADTGALAELTDYAVSSRYPGVYEDVTDDEHHHAIRLAEVVVTWASEVVDRRTGS